MPPRMPNFFIVGAARSGTTSLNRYLSQHPDIFISKRKEPHFFAADLFPPRFTGPGDDLLNRAVIQDIAQYQALFADAGVAHAVGESSVFYLCFPTVAERIAKAIPDAKIIIVLREPAERAYSAHMMLTRDDRETLSFARGLEQEGQRKRLGFEPMWWYKEVGLYAHQVAHVLDIFGKQQVHVVLYDDLSARPEHVMRGLFAFLGVKDDVRIDTSVHYNVGGAPRWRWIGRAVHVVARRSGVVATGIKPAAAWKVMRMLTQRVPVNAHVYADLQSSFAADVLALEDILGRDLSAWRAGVADLQHA